MELNLGWGKRSQEIPIEAIEENMLKEKVDINKLKLLKSEYERRLNEIQFLIELLEYDFGSNL
jgi:hypothetical protein